MKTRTNSFKIFLVSIVFVFANCQKDDNGNTTQVSQTLDGKSITKTVSAKDIPEVMAFISSKTNGKMQFLINDNDSPLGQNRSHEDNLVLTNAITEQIKQVTNSYGKSNYTFKLIEEGDKERYLLFKLGG